MMILERYHCAVLAEVVFPGTLAHSFQVNYVDQRLTFPKFWRDVYRYGKDGKPAGWTRYDGSKATDFTADGLAVLEKDARGRPLKARTVRYGLDLPYNVFAHGRKPLRQVWGDEVVRYAYDGDKVEVKREKVKEE
jgi:hypothetical protein